MSLWRDMLREVVAPASWPSFMPAHQAPTAAAAAAPKAAPVPLEPAAEPRRYSGARSPWRTSRFAAGLTPARIDSLLSRAEQGWPGDFCQLVHEIESKDLHMQAELGKRRRAVLSVPWKIVPASTRLRDRKVAEGVLGLLHRTRRWQAGMLNLLDAIAKGYAVVELDWVIEGNQAWVRQLQYRPQWWFVPDQDNVQRWRIVDDGGGSWGVEAPPHRLMVHEAQSTIGWPWQAGLGKGLVWFYLFKRYGLGDWVSYAELFGAPLRVGRYGPGSKPDDISRLESALDKLGVDAWAALPESMKIEFHQASGGQGADVFERLVAACDRQVSIGVLGQTLTTTEGKSGSRALGDVHNDVRWDLTRSDALELAETLTEQLVTPLVRFNFGDVELPRFEFVLKEPADEKLIAEVRQSRVTQFKGLQELGITLSEAQIREELDLRIPDGAADELAKPATEKFKKPEATPAAHTLTGCVPCSQVAAADLPEHFQQLDGLVAHFRKEGGDQAWAAVVEAMQAGLGQAESLEELPAVFVEVVEELELEDLAEQLSAATFTAELLGRLHLEEGDGRILDVPALPPREAVDWWTKTKKVVTRKEFDALDQAHRAQAFTIAGWHSLDALQKASDALRDTMEEGGTLADFEDKLAAHSLAIASPKHLDLVWTNNTNTAYAVGRYVQATRPATLSRRPYWRYMTVQDSRVRVTHQNMHGRVWAANDAIWMVWYPPNGQKCRCWVVSLDAEALKALGLEVETDLPQDEIAGRPLMPDPGWRTNPALEPHEFDFTRFPQSWRKGLGMES